MLRVLMVAAECAPFAKAGGLADVLGALPMALEKLGVSVTIAIPRHRVIDLRESGFEPVPSSGDARVSLGFESIPYEIHRSQLPRSSVEVFLIGNDRFFDRPGIYVDSMATATWRLLFRMRLMARSRSFRTAIWIPTTFSTALPAIVTITRPDSYLPISPAFTEWIKVLRARVPCSRFTTLVTRVGFHTLFYFERVLVTARSIP